MQFRKVTLSGTFVQLLTIDNLKTQGDALTGHHHVDTSEGGRCLNERIVFGALTYVGFDEEALHAELFDLVDRRLAAFTRCLGHVGDDHCLCAVFRGLQTTARPMALEAPVTTTVLAFSRSLISFSE
jgi:hypothetical protein